MSNLLNFFEYYNSDLKFKTTADTLNITDFPIKFPQFIAILLRCIQFVQTSNLLMKGHTFDSTAASIINRIT